MGTTLDLTAVLASGPLLGAFIAALVEALKKFLPLGGRRTLGVNFLLCLAFPVLAHLLSWDQAGSSWKSVMNVAVSAAVFGTGSWAILRSLRSDKSEPGSPLITHNSDRHPTPVPHLSTYRPASNPDTPPRRVTLTPFTMSMPAAPGPVLPGYRRNTPL